MGSVEGAGFAPAADDDDESWMRLDDDVLPRQIKKVPPVKRRGKLIMLEDILKKQKKSEILRKTKKVAKLKQKSDSSGDGDSSEDSDDFIKRGKVEQLLQNSQLILDGDSEVTFFKWGERIFGQQNRFPDFTVSESDTGLISRTLKFMAAEGRSSPAESMASNGLLYSWAILEGRCDETTARWIFHQLAYSNNRLLAEATCKILCDLLVAETRDGKPLCKFEWLPSLEDIMDTFHIYGYMDTCGEDDLGAAKPSEKAGSNLLGRGEDAPCEPTVNNQPGGPPSNIRSMLQFLKTHFKARKWHQTLSIPAAERLVVILFRCQLDRCMLNVSNLLQSCLGALIHYFTDEEWTCTNKHVASAISRISSTFENNLHVAKSLHATSSRLGSLQRLVVLQLLSRRVEPKRDLSSAEDVVSIFKSVKPKDPKSNLLNLYYLLMLADIYLWSDSSVQKMAALHSWLEVLKKCSSQISAHDRRPDAMKVRNSASFFRQKYQVEMMHTNMGVGISKLRS